ncbi:MAG: nucleoside monophosphate kinase, partial [Candidatus Pacebacteria bacterium]|nr:nucleoside monophosphate kinase [Candidatus Paceibacterota bacterium]
MNVFFLGKPTCGKGTQSKLVAEKYGLDIISTGNLFRELALQDNVIGNKIKSDLDNGQIMPSSFPIYLILNQLFLKNITDGFVFEGSPRKELEARVWCETFMWFNNEMPLFIYLDIPDEEVVKRALGRMICVDCKTNVSKHFTPDIEVCPKCGGKLVRRDDDNEEVVKKRIQVYYEDAKPAIDYLKQQGRLIEVSGIGSVEEIFTNISKEIDNY